MCSLKGYFIILVRNGFLLFFVVVVLCCLNHHFQTPCVGFNIKQNGTNKTLRIYKEANNFNTYLEYFLGKKEIKRKKANCNKKKDEEIYLYLIEYTHVCVCVYKCVQDLMLELCGVRLSTLNATNRKTQNSLNFKIKLYLFEKKKNVYGLYTNTHCHYIK